MTGKDSIANVIANPKTPIVLATGRPSYALVLVRFDFDVFCLGTLSSLMMCSMSFCDIPVELWLQKHIPLLVELTGACVVENVELVEFIELLEDVKLIEMIEVVEWVKLFEV